MFGPGAPPSMKECGRRGRGGTEVYAVIRPVLDEFVASEGVQEFLCDSFLQTEIPGSLKYGTFVGEARLYTIHAIKPA
jgi:hypothetical protein